MQDGVGCKSMKRYCGMSQETDKVKNKSVQMSKLNQSLMPSL